jgi:hypothetical protein
MQGVCFAPAIGYRWVLTITWYSQRFDGMQRLHFPRCFFTLCVPIKGPVATVRRKAYSSRCCFARSDTLEVQCATCTLTGIGETSEEAHLFAAHKLEFRSLRTKSTALERSLSRTTDWSFGLKHQSEKTRRKVQTLLPPSL